jgi:hypothetical protein
MADTWPGGESTSDRGGSEILHPSASPSGTSTCSREVTRAAIKALASSKVITSVRILDSPSRQEAPPFLSVSVSASASASVSVFVFILVFVIVILIVRMMRSRHREWHGKCR